MNHDTSQCDKAERIPAPPPKHPKFMTPKFLSVLADLSDCLESMVCAVNEVRKTFEDALPTIEEVAGVCKIPYDYIDPELRDLARAMNEYDCIEVTASYFGDERIPAEVVFELSDEECGWGDLRYDILSEARFIDNAHISISEHYYLDDEGDLKSNWVLSITPHSRTTETNEMEEDRVRRVKREVIEDLVDIMEADEE